MGELEHKVTTLKQALELRVSKWKRVRVVVDKFCPPPMVIVDLVLEVEEGSEGLHCRWQKIEDAWVDAKAAADKE